MPEGAFAFVPLAPRCPLTAPNAIFTAVDWRRKSQSWFDNKRGECQKRQREDTLEGERKENNNTKPQTIKIPFRHKRDSSEPGHRGPLMTGPTLSICEGEPDGCNVSTEWVSGFLPCHPHHTVHW